MYIVKTYCNDTAQNYYTLLGEIQEKKNPIKRYTQIQNALYVL